MPNPLFRRHLHRPVNVLRSIGFSAILLAIQIASASAQLSQLPQDVMQFYPNDRTQSLAAADRVKYYLAVNRNIAGMNAYTEAAATFYSTYLGYLNQTLNIFLTARILNPEDRSSVEMVLKGTNIARQLNDATQDIVAFQYATTPSRISRFYAIPDGAPKLFQPVNPAVPMASSWLLQKNMYYPLSFWVTLQSPGTGNREIHTLAYYSRLLTGVIYDRIPKGPKELNEQIYNFVLDAVSTSLKAIVGLIRTKSVVDFGFHPSDDWINSGSFSLNFGPKDIVDIGLGDTRVVQIDRFDSSRVKMAERNYQYFIQGFAPGKSELFAEFTPTYASIGINGVHSIDRMELTVFDNQQPAPQISVLPAVPSAPPPPVLPAAAPVPRLPPPGPLAPLPGPPRLPAVPAPQGPPKFQLCDNNQGSLSPAQGCELPK